MSRFHTVKILEAECLMGGKYIAHAGVAMCRSPKSAHAIAQQEVNRGLSAKSNHYGGTPIYRGVNHNGVDVVACW